MSKAKSECITPAKNISDTGELPLAPHIVRMTPLKARLEVARLEHEVKATVKTGRGLIAKVKREAQQAKTDLTKMRTKMHKATCNADRLANRITALEAECLSAKDQANHYSEGHANQIKNNQRMVMEHTALEKTNFELVEKIDALTKSRERILDVRQNMSGNFEGALQAIARLGEGMRRGAKG